MKFRVQRGRETELITAVLAGEFHLYHELIRPYERTVYMMSLSYMKNEKDAEEIAQETFIRAFRDLSTFREDSKFSAWLISIAINEARSQLRREMTTRTASLGGPQSGEMSASPILLRGWRELPSGRVEREEITSLLQQAVERLPRIYQHVLLRRDAGDSI